MEPYIPKPMLFLDQHEISRPSVRAIDAHNHLGLSFGEQWSRRNPSELIDVLDEAGIDSVVNLDGGFGDDFEREMDRWARLEDRVLTFAGVSWKRLAKSSALGERAALELESAAKAGARGLKIWKDLGLMVRDATGALIEVDTP